MLKIASAASPTNKNPEQDSQKIQAENQGKKKLVQKSCKGKKGPKTAKFKKWIRVQKTKASRVKNFSLGQLGTLLIADVRRVFTKLR